MKNQSPDNSKPALQPGARAGCTSVHSSAAALSKKAGLVQEQCTVHFWVKTQDWNKTEFSSVQY